MHVIRGMYIERDNDRLTYSYYVSYTPISTLSTQSLRGRYSNCTHTNAINLTFCFVNRLRVRPIRRQPRK